MNAVQSEGGEGGRAVGTAAAAIPSMVASAMVKQEDVYECDTDGEESRMGGRDGHPMVVVPKKEEEDYGEEVLSDKVPEVAGQVQPRRSPRLKESRQNVNQNKSGDKRKRPAYRRQLGAGATQSLITDVLKFIAVGDAHCRGRCTAQCLQRATELAESKHFDAELAAAQLKQFKAMDKDQKLQFIVTSNKLSLVVRDRLSSDTGNVIHKRPESSLFAIPLGAGEHVPFVLCAGCFRKCVDESLETWRSIAGGHRRRKLDEIPQSPNWDRLHRALKHFNQDPVGATRVVVVPLESLMKAGRKTILVQNPKLTDEGRMEYDTDFTVNGKKGRLSHLDIELEQGECMIIAVEVNQLRRCARESKMKLKLRYVYRGGNASTKGAAQYAILAVATQLDESTISFHPDEGRCVFNIFDANKAGSISDGCGRRNGSSGRTWLEENKGELECKCKGRRTKDSEEYEHQMAKVKESIKASFSALKKASGIDVCNLTTKSICYKEIRGDHPNELDTLLEDGQINLSFLHLEGEDIQAQTDMEHVEPNASCTVIISVSQMHPKRLPSFLIFQRDGRMFQIRMNRGTAVQFIGSLLTHRLFRTKEEGIGPLFWNLGLYPNKIFDCHGYKKMRDTILLNLDSL